MKLNADLGEHEPPSRTRALMKLIDLANIACGGHAGTSETMKNAVRLALENRVAIGAHPGLAADFGRGDGAVGPLELESLLGAQVDALAAVAKEEGGRLDHLKLHGSLYHAVEQTEVLARAYVETVRARYPGLKIVAFAGGRVVDLCHDCGVEALPEVFAERGYQENGTLVPRGKPGDLITEPEVVAERVRLLLESRCLSGPGFSVPIDARTICVHSDTPNAIRIAEAARRVLGDRQD